MNRLDTNQNTRFKAQVRHYHRSSEGLRTWENWVNPGHHPKSKAVRRPWRTLLAVLIVLLFVGALVAGFVLMTKPG
jgi:uncharacterized membrane protein YccC